VVTMTEDPWKDLSPPSMANAINAKRVSADVPWGFFWARSVDDKCLFVIQHNVDSLPSGRLPKLKGITVTDSDGPDGDDRVLIFKLEESVHRDLFHRLCIDIVECASAASTEKEAVLLAIARTWRWHHLLRGGSDKTLTLEQQKGLMGELLVIERHLLPVMCAVDAVAAWRGPLGAPKDFEIGQICVEVKSRRGAATPLIAVSSENQLDESDLEILFLYVSDLDRAPSDSPAGASLTEVALRVREIIVGMDQGAVEAFEGLLAAAGFRWSDDYSATLWIEGTNRLYRVHGDFPRITAGQIASGVGTVRYSISLVECEPYLAEMIDLESAIRRYRDVD
jgi:Putative  PD-(D/E)XK family member, (DUF4420)